MPSIPTLGSLNVPVSNAVVEALRDLATELDAKSGSIIGRGSDVMEQMNSTAVEFTELVSEPLRRMGTESIEAARTAMAGSLWGSTITNRWAEDAEVYQQVAEQFSGLWAEQVASGFGVTAESAGVTAGMPSDVASTVMDNAVAEAGAGSLSMFQTVIDKAYEKYKQDAKTAGGMLKGGPTPANLKTLAAGGGGASWAMFNLFGAAAGPPKNLTGADGAKLAELMRDVLGGDKRLTPDLLNRFQAMFALAEWAESGKGPVNAGQLAFLERFFAGLDEPYGPKPFGEIPSALWAVPTWLERSNASAADQAAVLAAMGGGLLVLSNKDFGGGMGRLPGSLAQNLGYYTGAVDKRTGTLENVKQLEALGKMFGAATDKGLKTLQGGREFSSALTLAVAEEFALFHERRPPHFMPGGAESLEPYVADLLGVALRDPNVSADLLTGDFQHPEYGKDTPEHVMRSMFGYNWKDDGKAASGLIDWIGDAQAGTDPALKLRAQETAYNLITVMGGESKSAHWDQSPYQFFSDAYGEVNGFKNAPLGVANPEIARAMGDTAIAYLDHFDDAEPLDRSGGGEETMASWLKLGGTPADTDMYLAVGERSNFFELVMGDKQAADELGTAVYTKVFLESGDMPGWTEPGTAEKLANRHGTLIGMLESGLANVHADAVGDLTADKEQEAQNSAWIRAAASISKELVQVVPGVRNTKWDLIFRELHEVFKAGPPLAQAEGWAFTGGTDSGAPTLSQSHGKETLGLEISQSMVDQGLADPKHELDLDDVRAVDDRLLDKNGSGQEALRSADDLLGANHPREGGKQITIEDAQSALRRLYPGRADEWYDDYLQHLILQRDAVAGRTTD